MENEQVQTSYWQSVLIGALFTALVIFIVGLISGYMTINAEPTGSIISAGQLVGVLSCLIGALGGIISTRHYAKTYDITFTIGKGAMIGLYTGLIAAFISTLLTQLWLIMDPGYVQGFIDSTIANMEAMSNIPEETKQQLLAETEAKLNEQFDSVSGILIGGAISMVTFGFINLLTGMIGAKIFASED